MSKEIKKIDMLGIGISEIGMDDALREIENHIISKKPIYICVCPNHTIMESQKNHILKEIVNSAYMATPDGMSVVWSAKILGYKQVEQVCGTDLMLRLSALSAEKGYTNFYYGGTKGVPEKLSEKLSNQFPNLKVIGKHSPPFSSLTLSEKNEVISMINSIKPDILWVGLGMPKQELWMGEYYGKLDVSVMIGVGAAFDFLSGNKKRAPKWMQKVGLEWLFRLIKEPRRLWKRNLYHPLFLFRIILQKLKMMHLH